jgi:hypothetical protein
LLYDVEAFKGGGIFIRQGIYSKFFFLPEASIYKGCGVCYDKKLNFFAFLFGGMKIKAVY